ncbi:hypothetical protein OAT74_01525 [Flavobacteriaceae bacterium]|nr:hypothetical protein [Flavobacteriaceae bacterium]
MKASTSFLMCCLLLFLWTSCKKDENLTTDETDNTGESISNLSKTPDLLLGSWNLKKDDSTPNQEKSDSDCEASNIHFLDDNVFYLNYLEKRIRGKYEIIDSVSIDLLSVRINILFRELWRPITLPLLGEEPFLEPI